MRVTEKDVVAFGDFLCMEERSPATVEKYLRDIRQFLGWIGKRPISKAEVACWKEELSSKGYFATTINGKLTALDRFFAFLGCEMYCVKHLKLQRRMFRDAGRELAKEEYERLIATASAQGKSRLALLMETICATGIRVSEVQYITVEAVKNGRAEISMKGKIRTILIPGKLRRKLEKYAQKNKIVSGEIFLTRNGKSLGRRQIWGEMKAVCKKAGVEMSKVFPHNLRHLFARAFYQVCRDIAKLADVLGHSSVETTRIYLISTGAEHAKALDRLRLVQ